MRANTPAVLVSATALSTVIDVLVENAVRHGRGTVTVDAGPAHGGAAITVADEGRLNGDPDAIFDRRSTQAGSHGIGLALDRSLAHAEGARLRLSRRDPTTFEVIIAAVATVPSASPATVP